MKPLTQFARLLLVILTLAAIGCGEPLTAKRGASCIPAGTAIACEATLDAFIAEGGHRCDVGDIGVLGDLVLASDGTANSYERHVGATTLTGSWARVERTVDLHPDDGSPDVTIDVIEDGGRS